MVTVVAICLPTCHAVHARDASGLVPESVLHLRVERVVVVLAIILLAGVAEKMFVAELAVADAGVEPFLFMGRGLSHRTVDPLATAVDGDATRISGRRSVGLSDT